MEPLYGSKLYKEGITNQKYNSMMSELMMLVFKYRLGEDVDTDRIEYIGELFDMAEEDEDEDEFNHYKEYLRVKKEREEGHQ